MSRESSPLVPDGDKAGRPLVALLPWGDFIEDYLHGIGISLEDFALRMAGGWLFGYAEALRLQGIDTLVVCFSAEVDAVKRFVRPDTALRTTVFPASRAYRWFRRRMVDPYAWTVDGAVGPTRGPRRWFWKTVRPLIPYLATPILPLGRELRRMGCRAILCQEYESPRFDVSVATGRTLRIPTVATFQGGSWQASRLESVVRPLALRAAAGVVIGSRAESERVTMQYGLSGEKIARIFNPLDAPGWRAGARAAVRRELGIQEDAPLAVWHGRVEMQRKGLDTLLQAWRLICEWDRDGDSRLLMVGAGVDSADLDGALRTFDGPDSRVVRVAEFVLDRTRVRDYLAAADVYVFPSRHEGFAVAPLEAMACGLPVVATDAPGILDVFEHGPESGGVVVPREDPDSLARALLRLLRDPEHARELGTRARHRVDDAFSLSRVGAQLAAFLEQRGVDLSRGIAAGRS